MCSRMLFVIMCFVLLPVLAFSQNEFNYKEVNQGDWAVVLVRGLNLDENRELVKVEDFTELLKQNGITPKDGWQANQKLTYQDFAGTIGLALIHLNSKDSKKKSADFNNLLSFLENKIGLNLSQLQASLQKNESLKNLNEGISNYLAQKQEPGSSETNQELPANRASSGNIQSRAAQNSNPALADAGALIQDLAAALAVRDAGPSPGYWKAFSEPASPILPNETP